LWRQFVCCKLKEIAAICTRTRTLKGATLTPLCALYVHIVLLSSIGLLPIQDVSYDAQTTVAYTHTLGPVYACFGLVMPTFVYKMCL
jgi:hypothetical protein